MADLHGSIHAGKYPWFRHEFETAIRQRVFSADTWTDAVGTSPLTTGRDDRSTVADEQLVVWQAVFAGDPFPLPTPTAVPRASTPPTSQSRRLGEPVTAVRDGRSDTAVAGQPGRTVH
jgi:hypothetical protein